MKKSYVKILSFLAMFGLETLMVAYAGTEGDRSLQFTDRRKFGPFFNGIIEHVRNKRNAG